MNRRDFFAPVSRILNRLDFFYAGAWWWHWRCRTAERQLEKALESYGEKSFECARATHLVAQMDFAALYWRSAPDGVRRAVQEARKVGIPLDALRLVVLNRDLQLRGGRVCVRRSHVLPVFAAVAWAIVWTHWLLMILLTLTAQGSWPLKIVVAIAVTVIYFALYRGWSLFLSRPCRIISRWRSHLERVLDTLASASVLRRDFHG